MRNPVPIVLLALVALSLPISAAGTAGSAAAQDGNDGITVVERPSVTTDGDHAQLDGTPNRLVLEGDRRTAYATPSTDVGLVLANQDESIDADHRTFALETRLAEYEDDEQRRDAIVAELERIEERIGELRDREQAVVAAHAAGEASEDEVLHALARNYHEARELQRALDRINDASNGIADVSGPSGPVRHFNGELDIYTSPIRTEIDTALRGDEAVESDASTPGISIESTADGLVLSTIDGNEYVREATRYDNRAPNRYDRIRTMDEAGAIGEELYPWAFETTSGTSKSKFGIVQLYRVEATSHDHGYLDVYLDGGTGAVYHERQVLDVNRIPIETADAIEGENVTATLEQTSGATPATVTVTDGDGETPIDATVVVDGTVVGETNEEGRLRFVPPTDEFELRVQTASESLNATVTASR